MLAEARLLRDSLPVMAFLVKITVNCVRTQQKVLPRLHLCIVDCFSLPFCIPMLIQGDLNVHSQSLFALFSTTQLPYLLWDNGVPSAWQVCLWSIAQQYAFVGITQFCSPRDSRCTCWRKDYLATHPAKTCKYMQLVLYHAAYSYSWTASCLFV